MSGCYFPKRLVYTLQGLWCCCCCFFFKDRSEVQIDSNEAYLTLWCHQPYSNQYLNPQTVVEFEGQEGESSWIFQKKDCEFGGAKTQL